MNVARAALRDIQQARAHLSEADYRQLNAYFERTVLTARQHHAVATAYFGYRIYVQGPEQRTDELKALIWTGLDDARQIADAVRDHPDRAASGEWDWLRDAAEADTYHTRTSEGWDRYGGIAVPRPDADSVWGARRRPSEHAGD
ncbi:hypothetical protein O7599_17100 [Streptomyces sp. WMMC500]|uniref:hypothetical protein n=1 Tax=Streptomyces sp. WMMC500 TaxID=3015154 RepID=UPI00248CEE5A|nr:hypothetical protein [Streptomyces sp. WMMC500]WBB64126.1 hypothetical protein O7599_17100 [Streptomyces sp. WMMC500]